MVRVIDNYVIDVSDNCYQVGKLATTTNKKTGETTEYIAAPKYVSTFDAALKCIRKSMRMERLKDFDGTLTDAINLIIGIDQNFEDSLGQIKGA